MKLCMFRPVAEPMERGWVGRLDGDHVVQLAAQKLESYFTGGGTAREHAVYPLSAVRLLAPVLHPPSIRVFDDETSFEFANPAAVVGPGAAIASDRPLELLPRLAAVVGLDGALGGFTAFAEWRRPGAPVPKDRDFALSLGPVVVTPDALAAELTSVVHVDGDERLQGRLDGFAWSAARDLAARGTVLRPGDLLAGPAAGRVDAIPPETLVELDVTGIGTLSGRTRQTTARVYEDHEARLGRDLTLREVIAGEFRSVRAPIAEVVAWVRENVRLRRGFVEFARRYRPLVVSSGFHELIEPVLEREGLELHVTANRVDPRPDGWRVLFREVPVCPVCEEPCKRSDLAGLDEIVFVGDGFSDRCVALAASRVFARDGLATYLASKGVPYEAFADFYDVQRALDAVDSVLGSRDHSRP